MTEYYKPLQAAIANLHHALKVLGSDTPAIVELDSLSYSRLHDSIYVRYTEGQIRQSDFEYHGVIIRDGRR